VSERQTNPDQQASVPSRRTGGRRRTTHAETIDPGADRRQGDRRQRPGLLALFQDIFIRE
jgi:hypothetical protein